jgi:hypothetical protein
MDPIHPAELTELAAGLNRLAWQWGQQPGQQLTLDFAPTRMRYSCLSL